MPTVCAVIVTCNRKELLDNCLRAVDAQSHRCDRIVVIDNASSDGTFEMLAERWGDRVEVHALRWNVGAAGGFNAGMRIAYLSQADTIWVMDDDVIPEPEALERLLAAGEALEGNNLSAAFLVSTARSPSGILTNVPDVDIRHNALSYQNWPHLLEHRLVPVKRATFVSILFPHATLARYGLPIASMFIWGEDSEFTLRVTGEQAGYLVGDSRVVHVRAAHGKLDICTEKDPIRIGYHFYLIRNSVYRLRQYARRRKLARHLIHQVRLFIRLCSRGQFAKAKIVFMGTFQGLIFNPVVEAADAPFDVNAIPTFTCPTSLPNTEIEADSPPTV